MPNVSDLKVRPASPTQNTTEIPKTTTKPTSPLSPSISSHKSPHGTDPHHIDPARQPQLGISFHALNMFLVKAIERIAAERETKKSQNTALRKACEEALQLLRQQHEDHVKSNSEANQTPPTDHISDHLPPLRSETGMLLSDEKLLRPFQLACSLKSAKIVTTAIDSLQKLIAYGHVPNEAMGSTGKVRIIEQIVTTICSCFQGVHTDDGIQLQVLKALLTVITSSVVEIHEADVLLVVRTCYNIFMATKNPVNQATARATLTQIISIIFSRMEQNAFDAVVALSGTDGPVVNDHDDQLPTDSGQGTTSMEETVKEISPVVDQNSEFKPRTDQDVDSTLSVESEADLSLEDGESADAIVRSILDEIIEQPILGSNDGEMTQLANAEQPTPPATPTGDEAARSKPASPLPNGVLADEDAVKAESINGAHPEAVALAHVTQKDAFLVFRSLCRLATKDFGGTRSSDARSNAIRSKTLSLQLLLSVFQQPGPLFLSSEIFITAIKQYLCVALIKNGVSPVPEVCELSVTIFLALLTHFKPHLKRQIEVFLKDVFLEILESPKSSFEHKWLVIEALRRICADAQCVVDIYLNYDCDMSMANIFERLTTSLAKIAQGRYAGEHGSSVAQRQAIRTSGLECLVLILRCMVDWSQDLYTSPESQSFLGAEPSVTMTDASEVSMPNGMPNGPTTGTVGHQKAIDDPEDFESRKAQKEIYETGIQLFNQGRMIRGLKLLQQHGLISDTVESVAEFLKTEERLVKARIGDFLGENDPYNLHVMYAYVDQFDFADKEFLPSMREFLAGFRLPGEAQKIDRLMEKFAARYCACNPNNGLFASADTAYVLAFSIIMLTTDLHSVQIKQHHRMTKDDYIRMNRCINDSQDLPEAYLGQIYDEIANCSIQLRSDDALSRLTGAKLLTMGSQTNEYRSPSNAKTDQPRSQEDLLNSIDNTYSDFTSATQCEHVRPMFKLAWTPFLAAFSVGLQDCDALDVAHLCLEGIRYSIRIACIFHMETERDAYVQALARFTLLLTSSAAHATNSGAGSSTTAGAHSSSRRPKSEMFPSSSTASLSSSGSATGPGFNTVPVSTPEAMKQKNIDTIRTLITIAQTDGNYLGHAWLEILRCISQLESAHLITQAGAHSNSGLINGASGSTGLLHRAASLAAPPSHTSPLSSHVTSKGRGPPQSSSSSSILSLSSLPGVGFHEPVTAGTLAAASVDPRKAAILQEVMGETGSDSVIVAVDKIFSGSIRLNGDAIVDFVKALCQVSREELMLPHPRTFSLQKVVEISYYNMGRIRLQWSRVWEHIGGHFTAAGQSANEDVAEFVVDSLRQLAVKLIEKGELPNFHFQKEFLRPFVSILDSEQTLTRKIQDMVIRCVSQLVHSQYMNIRSGWTNIFAVLHRVAASSDEALVDMAFETCSFTVTEVLTNHISVVLDAFQPLVKLLNDFACNPHFPDMAMESIRLTRLCAHLVSQHRTAFANLQSSPSSTVAIEPQLTSKDLVTISSPVVRRSTGSEPMTTSAADEDNVWLKGWMPVLCELFRVINSCKLDVRTRGLTIFFDILKTYGDQFKPLWWRETFTIIFRVFQHFRAPSLSSHYQSSSSAAVAANSSSYNNSLSSMEQTEWMNTTCNHTLFSIVDVFTQYYDTLSNILLEEVYGQLRWCCLQEHEQLARSGTSCLETLVLSTGKQFTHEIWDRTVNLIVGLFEASVPHQLLTWKPDSRAQSQSPEAADVNGSSGVPRYLAQARLFADLLIKCVVQYELIQAVDHILFYSSHSRNEDAYYLNESRALAASSYPAYAAALASSSIGDKHSDGRPVASSRSPSADHIWTPDETLDADETIPASPESLWLGPSGARVMVGARPLPPDPRGMYSSLSPQHRLALARCLLESHAFAKKFNSNDEQRNILFEAGFKVKAKPNLLKQETHSLLCALRILFPLAEQDTDVREETEELLDRVILDALSYYHDLIVDGHRQAWDPCLILIITQLTRLTPATRFHRHATRVFAGVCDLVPMAGGVSPEVAALVRLFLLRCGAFFLPPFTHCDSA